MHFVCTICSDFLNPTKNICVTECGHLFHHNCLVQWIQRSHTCPQCRNKVTETSISRVFPTAAEAREDATTLQAQLDDAQLQLRHHLTHQATKDKEIQELIAQCNNAEKSLKACEKKLMSKEMALTSLREQVEYLKIQNKETERLKEENEVLKKNVQTLTGLERVLNSTKEEAEQMLASYSDVRTVALFATALKRALCDAEDKRKEYRQGNASLQAELRAERALALERLKDLTQVEEKLLATQRKYEALKHKRKASEAWSGEPEPEPGSGPRARDASAPKQPRDSFDDVVNETIDEHNGSIGGLVRRVESAESPYLRLRRAPPALAAAHALHASEHNIKPSELALLNYARNAKPAGGNENANSHEPNKLSIFRTKESVEMKFAQKQPTSLDICYDGLGGRARRDALPRPGGSRLPKPTAKHRLKRPNTSSPGKDIGDLFKRIQNESSS